MKGGGGEKKGGKKEKETGATLFRWPFPRGYILSFANNSVDRAEERRGGGKKRGRKERKNASNFRCIPPRTFLRMKGKEVPTLPTILMNRHLKGIRGGGKRGEEKKRGSFSLAKIFATMLTVCQADCGVTREEKQRGGGGGGGKKKGRMGESPDIVTRIAEQCRL